MLAFGGSFLTIYVAGSITVQTFYRQDGAVREGDGGRRGSSAGSSARSRPSCSWERSSSSSTRTTPSRASATDPDELGILRRHLQLLQLVPGRRSSSAPRSSRSSSRSSAGSSRPTSRELYTLTPAGDLARLLAGPVVEAARGLLGALLVRERDGRPPRRADRRGGGLRGTRGPCLARPVRARVARGHDVRRAGPRLRVRCLRHAHLPERRRRPRRAGRGHPAARRRAARGRSRAMRAARLAAGGGVAARRRRRPRGRGRPDRAAAGRPPGRGPGEPRRRLRRRARRRRRSTFSIPPARLRLEPARRGDPRAEIVATARVGVAYAGPGWADRPWRFVVAGTAAAGARA